MNAARSLPSPPDPSTIDHFVHLHGVSWSAYEAILAMRGDESVPRITYLRGTLELMSPSRYHENDKKRLARLLERWAEESGLRIQGIGRGRSRTAVRSAAPSPTSAT